MLNMPSHAVQYRVASMIDQGKGEAEIRTATGAPSRLIQGLMNASTPTTDDPNRPNAREMIVIQYLTDQLANVTARSTDQIAADLNINNQEAIAIMSSLYDRGFVQNDLDTILLPTDPSHAPSTNEPRIGRLLFEQAAQRVNHTQDVDLALAAVMLYDDTTRVRIDAQQIAHIMGRSTEPDLHPQLPGWPLPGNVYIEYSNTVPIAPNLDPQEYGIDAMLIGRMENRDERTIIMFICREDIVQNYRLDFNVQTGHIANVNDHQNPTHQAMARFICAILRIIGPEGSGIEPVPDTEQEAKRRAQGERVIDWLQIRQQA